MLNERRQIFINRMAELEYQGMSCRGCAGTCCTYEANSMMVTPLEALEIAFHLQANERWNISLKNDCEETVKKYRLDHQTGDGRKSYLRRTYTCPFFKEQELGCTLSRSVKPYGCLAFNVHHQEVKAKEFCYSEISLLEAREKKFPLESRQNELLKEKYKIFWDKTPLPLALLDLWDKKISAADLVLS